MPFFQVPSTEAKMFDGFIKPWMVDIKKDPARPQATASSNPTPPIMLFVVENSAHIPLKRNMLWLWYYAINHFVSIKKETERDWLPDSLQWKEMAQWLLIPSGSIGLCVEPKLFSSCNIDSHQFISSCFQSAQASQRFPENMKFNMRKKKAQHLFQDPTLLVVFNFFQQMTSSILPLRKTWKK